MFPFNELRDTLPRSRQRSRHGLPGRTCLRFFCPPQNRSGTGMNKTSPNPDKKRPILCKIFGHPDPGSGCRRCFEAQRLLKPEALLLDFGAICPKSGHILHVSKGWFLGVFGLLSRILYPSQGGSLMNSPSSETERFCRRQPGKGLMPGFALCRSICSNHLGKCPMELIFPVRAVCSPSVIIVFNIEDK